MKPPLRVAILECDDPIDTVKESLGSYGNIFEKLLKRGAERLAADKRYPHVTTPPALEVSKYDVVNHELYPDLEDVDAVLLTGSKFNAYDNDTWILKLVAYTKKVLAQQRVRIIGVCFGHQIVGRAMEVKVDRSDKGWEIAVVPIQLSEKGQQLFGSTQLRIHQMHRDIVYYYPKDVEALGWTEVCEVQGMYSKNRLITVQGHPEFTEEIESAIIKRRQEMGMFTDEVYEEAMSRVGNDHDGLAIAAAFLQFLLDD